MHRSLLGGLAVACAATALAPASAVAAPAPFTYSVIGDTPYGDAALEALPDQIRQINEDSSVQGVVHLGDTKAGSQRCDDDYLERIRDAFDTFEDPVVYTPGDNEWTDCHRESNGGYQPAGPRISGAPVVGDGASRLDLIRRLYFARPGLTRGANPVRLDAQPGTPENMLWTVGGVTAASLHVVGSANDLKPWFGDNETADLRGVRLAENATRTEAALRWIDRAFVTAFASGSRGVLLAMQADMFDGYALADADSKAAFGDIVRRIALWSWVWGKPVLLLNGDSHAFVEDRPLAVAASRANDVYDIPVGISNLRRVVVDGAGDADEYLRLTTDPSSAEVFTWKRVPFADAG